MPLERILHGVELVMVSHLHSDHFDLAAQEMIHVCCNPHKFYKTLMNSCRKRNIMNGNQC